MSISNRGGDSASIARLLRRPAIRALATASMLARLPFAMGTVALVIFVHGRTGSFGASGAVAGAYTFSLAVGGPVLGRLVDRRGARLVLVPAAAVSSVAMVAVVVAGHAGASVPVLVAGGFLAGVTMPPISGVLRRTWPVLVEPAELPAAYLFDSILIDAVFVGGQLLTGLLAVAINPAAPLVGSAAFGLVGTIWFAARPEVTAVPPAAKHQHHRAGALASSTIRLLVFTGLPVGFTYGALDVALPAFAAERGSAALGGIYIALAGLGSVIGALAYGLCGSRFGDLRQSCVRLAMAQPLLSIPLLLVPSPLLLIVPALLAGSYAAPLLTVRSRIAQVSMPPGTGTETFTWLLLAVMAGASLGSLVAGPLVEATSWRLGIAAAIVVAAVALIPLIAWQGLLPRREPEPSIPRPGAPRRATEGCRSAANSVAPCSPASRPDPMEEP